MKLVDLIFNRKEAKKALLLEDVLLASDIVSGFDILSKQLSSKQGIYFKALEKIDLNKVYNSDLLYKDLLDYFKSREFDNILNRIRQAFGNKEETNIDNFFEQIAAVSFEDFIIADDPYSYIEFRTAIDTLIYNSDRIKDHLKLKTLKRYLRSELKNKIFEKQSRLTMGYPIILDLREFINNTFNIKKTSYGDIFNDFRNDLIFLLFKAHGNTIQNRFIMLLQQG